MGIALGLALAAGVALAGCGRPAGSSTTSVSLIHLAAPMRDAVWSSPERALVGVTPDKRLEKLVPATLAVTRSAALPDVGDDLATGLPGQAVVFVPQPSLNRVAVMRVQNLTLDRYFTVGPQPAYVTTDVGSNTLLALSRAGDLVTGVNIHHGDVVASQRLAEPADAVDGPERGRLVDFHVTGSHGITHYEDGDDRGSLAVPAGAAVTDEQKATREYVAETGTDDLLAVDSGRNHDGLAVVGRADLGAPVLFVGSDASRIYAVTQDALVVLETRAFGGFPNDQIPVLRRISFRSALPAGIRSAPISGLAVGTDRIYLTVANEPYVLDITKPSV